MSDERLDLNLARRYGVEGGWVSLSKMAYCIMFNDNSCMITMVLWPSHILCIDSFFMMKVSETGFQAKTFCLSCLLPLLLCCQDGVACQTMPRPTSSSPNRAWFAYSYTALRHLALHFVCSLLA